MFSATTTAASTGLGGTGLTGTALGGTALGGTGLGGTATTTSTAGFGFGGGSSLFLNRVLPHNERKGFIIEPTCAVCTVGSYASLSVCSLSVVWT